MVLYENDIEADVPAHSDITLDTVEIGGMAIKILESCHSSWIFEPSRSRFRRLPRGTRLDMPWPESDWTPYFRLEVDASTGAFAVGLNEDDTRVLRSWLHMEPCRHCGNNDQTGEISLAAVRKSVDDRG